MITLYGDMHILVTFICVTTVGHKEVIWKYKTNLILFYSLSTEYLPYGNVLLKGHTIKLRSHYEFLRTFAYNLFLTKQFKYEIKKKIYTFMCYFQR